MTESWPDLLDKYRGNYPSLLAFSFEWWHYNLPLLNRMREIVQPPGRILEVGTGTGALAIFLSALNYDVLGIDIEPRVVEQAKGLAKHFSVSCRFEVADAFDLASYERKFDLAFSAGVIEHFSSEDAAHMLREKGRAAKYVVAAVPTWFALRNDRLAEASDARIIKLKELKAIFELAGLEVFGTFGYGIPDGKVATFLRYLLPYVFQWFLQNRLSYACTIGCVGRSRNY
jgi:ubiquinone/menaquinone biosynthesis C-methylase UbiE